jgi:hypothetical protein
VPHIGFLVASCPRNFHDRFTRIVEPPNIAVPNLEIAKPPKQYAGTEPREIAESNEPASVCKRKAGSDFLA